MKPPKEKLEKTFFESPTASSQVKANIVTRYFPQYCKILLKTHSRTIQYVDLFSGPGMYKDGKFSTPMLIIESCAKDSRLFDRVELWFNDRHVEFIETLKVNICEQFPQLSLKHIPHFSKFTVGKSQEVHSFLTRDKTPEELKEKHNPTLLFIDPWGYKGIDTLALAKFMRYFGNELFLFVNTKRIQAAIDNGKFDGLIEKIFPTRIEELKRIRQYTSNVKERRDLVINNLVAEFETFIKSPEGGAYRKKLYSCLFKFKEEDNSGVSHYLLHLTKHDRGFELVKQVFTDNDNLGAILSENGTYGFDYKKNHNSEFQFENSNINYLIERLKEDFKGQTISALELYKKHNTSTNYSQTHYRMAIQTMAENGKIKVNFTDAADHKKSARIIEACILTFN